MRWTVATSLTGVLIWLSIRVGLLAVTQDLIVLLLIPTLHMVYDQPIYQMVMMSELNANMHACTPVSCI